MGLISDAVKAIGGFVGGSGGADLVGAGIGLIGNVLASDTAADAARDAAAQAAAGSERAIQFLEEGREAGTAAVREGGEAFRSEIGPIAAVNARGFTPAQEIVLDDAARESSARLAAGGLRGAGRAITEGVLEDRRRREAGFLDENRARQDRARLERAGSFEREGTGVGNIETGSAAQIGGAAQRGGELGAIGTSRAGQIEAGGTLANANLIGQTLGTIAAVTADAQKRNLVEDKPPAGRV